MINWIKEQLHRLTAPDKDKIDRMNTTDDVFEAEATVQVGEVMVSVRGIGTVEGHLSTCLWALDHMSGNNGKSDSDHRDVA